MWIANVDNLVLKLFPNVDNSQDPCGYPHPKWSYPHYLQSSLLDRLSRIPDLSTYPHWGKLSILKPLQIMWIMHGEVKFLGGNDVDN